MRHARWLVLSLCPAVVAAGCSLVNSFEDVKPLTTVKDTGTIGGDDTSVTPDTAMGVDTAPADDTGVVTTDTNVTPDTGPPTDKGLIVVNATQNADAGTGAPVLTVLDPLTGRRLTITDEKITVSAIRYDPDRDLWYLFINKSRASFNLLPTDVMELQVRSFDRVNNKWNPTLGTTTVPTLLNEDRLGVLLDGLAYISQAPQPGDASGDPVLSLTIVDTRTPAAPVSGANNTKALPAGYTPLGLLTTRASSQAGGYVNMFSESNCVVPEAGLSSCELHVINVLIPIGLTAPLSFMASKKLGETGPSGATVTAFAPFYNNGSWEHLVAIPPNGMATRAFVNRFLPLTGPNNSTGVPIGFDPATDGTSPSRRLFWMSVAECQKVVFVTDFIGNTVHSIPVTPGGAVSQFNLGRAAQRVVFEPYSKSVLAPFRTNAEVAALPLTGTVAAEGTMTTPVLGARRSKTSTPNIWDPPFGLAADQIQPQSVAVKYPADFPCPP